MKLFLSGSGMKKNECSAVVCRGRCVFMVEYTDIGKRKAEEQGDRVDVAADAVNIWDDFAKDMGQF